jgi:uncharacterized repeat protein (TIGR02543 family)
MKKLFAILVSTLIAFIGCDNTPKEIPVQNISIDIDNILFIGQQSYVRTEFFPSDTTERNLSYSSSDENILTINSSGTITPKNKGLATITIKCQNGAKVSKNVSVYQIVTKPKIINVSEEWGPFEKILGSGNSSYSNEIGINTGVEIKINQNTLVENARIIVAGKLFTNNCETENAIFSQVRLEGNGEYNLANITIDRLYITDAKKGIIANCDFIIPSRSYDLAFEITPWGGSLDLINNTFYGNCDFRVSFTQQLNVEYNVFMSNINFPSGSSKINYITFRYNTIDMTKSSFNGKNTSNASPNIDFANNYWGTTDTLLIDNFIIDRNDSLSISYYVNYLPILTEKPELSKYTVVFESNGGSVVQSIINIAKGSKINKPIDPTKQNHQFIGWYIDEKLETEWNFQNNTVEDSLTLYAKWKNTFIYQYEVTGVSGYKISNYIVLNWTNPTDQNFSHVRVILEGFEWAESMGGTDQDVGKISYSAVDYSGASFVIIKCVGKDGSVSEGIIYNL